MNKRPTIKRPCYIFQHPKKNSKLTSFLFLLVLRYSTLVFFILAEFVCMTLVLTLPWQVKVLPTAFVQRYQCIYTVVPKSQWDFSIMNFFLHIICLYGLANQTRPKKLHCLLLDKQHTSVATTTGACKSCSPILV
jgi:hypothetical protein